METAKIRPLATPKPLNRSSPKLAGLITSWMAPGMQNFVAIGSGVSALQIRDFAEHLGWLVSSFFGFFDKAIAYTLERIFTQNTFKDVFAGKEVPFGVTMTTFRPLNFRKKSPFWGPILTGLSFFAAENGFNMGMLQ